MGKFDPTVFNDNNRIGDEAEFYSSLVNLSKDDFIHKMNVHCHSSICQGCILIDISKKIYR